MYNGQTFLLLPSMHNLLELLQKTPIKVNFTLLHVPCISVKLLSKHWSNNMHIRVKGFWKFSHSHNTFQHVGVAANTILREGHLQEADTICVLDDTDSLQ